MKPNKTSSASNENSHEFPPNKKDKDRKLIILAGRQPLRTFKIYHTKFLSLLRQKTSIRIAFKSNAAGALLNGLQVKA
jgi:hypothetical protein